MILSCISLVGAMACVTESEHSEPNDVSRTEQAVTPVVQLWCGVGVGNAQVSILTPQQCEDDRPGETPKKIGFQILGDIVLDSNYEFDWRRPKKLTVQRGCVSTTNYCDLTVPFSAGCGNTQFGMVVGFRHKRNPPGQWQWVNAVANLRLSPFPATACVIAALEPPSCSVVMGECDWTYRQAWLLAGQSSNSDVTRNTKVEVSFTSGNSWCTSYDFQPAEMETWLVTVPTTTRLVRYRRWTLWIKIQYF
jgi:hypothetical protein